MTINSITSRRKISTLKLNEIYGGSSIVSRFWYGYGYQFGHVANWNHKHPATPAHFY